MKNEIKILIGDDHEIFLIGLKILLKSIGDFKIKFAFDGKDLFSKAITFDFDLIIADYHLPKLNGIEALTKIKKIKPNTKLILLSSMEEIRIKEVCIKNGIHGYIFKSEKKEVLTSSILNILSEKTFYSEKKDLNLEYLWNHPSNPFIKITKRELEILKEMIHGKSLKETGKTLKLSEKTVTNHRSNLKKKLGFTMKKIIEEAKIWGLR